MTIRLVLADDHPIVLAGLAQLFAAEPDFQVVARAANGEDALMAVRRLQPDILVLDLRMPVKDGLSVLRELKWDNSTTRVVALTAVDNADALEAVHLGAQGVVVKDMATTRLVECIREVHAGRKWLESRVVPRREPYHATSDWIEVLTMREREIAVLVAEGLHGKGIAAKLGITESTVGHHLTAIYAKLGVSDRLELAIWLLKQTRGGEEPPGARPEDGQTRKRSA